MKRFKNASPDWFKQSFLLLWSKPDVFLTFIYYLQRLFLCDGHQPTPPVPPAGFRPSCRSDRNRRERLAVWGGGGGGWHPSGGLVPFLFSTSSILNDIHHLNTPAWYHFTCTVCFVLFTPWVCPGGGSIPLCRSLNNANKPDGCSCVTFLKRMNEEFAKILNSFCNLHLYVALEVISNLFIISIQYNST